MTRTVFVASLLVLLALAGPASAAIVIDFEQGTVVGGTITYNATMTSAVGVNIPVDIMKVTIGATTTFYDLFGAGPSSVESPANGSALVNFNTSTGAFTIVGGVCTAGTGSTACPGANTLVAGGTTLVNGTGSSAHIVSASATNLDLQEPDTKAPALLSALGLTGLNFALMDANFNSLTNIGGTTYSVGSVDIANTAVPEPTSILLLGTVLVGVTQLLRRRTGKA